MADNSNVEGAIALLVLLERLTTMAMNVGRRVREAVADGNRPVTLEELDAQGDEAAAAIEAAKAELAALRAKRDA